MIPVIAIFAASFLPGTLPFMAPFAIEPYTCLLLGMALAYFPFGVLLILKIQKGKTGNTDPRKDSAVLGATSPMAARCSAAHNNMLEGYGFFAAAVLGALQAGVSAAVVSQFATFWVFIRFAFVVIYIIQTNEIMGAMRSLTFVGALVAQSKLFFLAAGK